MDVKDTNSAEDTDMAECDGEKVVTMMDVLQEQQEFEEDANAVLGASDDKECTYAKGYIKRQAIYACLTCCAEARTDPTKRAGVCLACSLNCHENHDLIELYTKRNFRCDCGNPKFNSHPCQFVPDKTDLNEDNKYNQNFSGLYCTCHRPYPDPESTSDEEMIQCIICEDWLHASHLEATVPANNQYAEMICKGCMEANEFIHDYTDFSVNTEAADVDVTTVDNNASGIENKINGVIDTEESDNKEAKTMDVDTSETEKEIAHGDIVDTDTTSSVQPPEEYAKNETEKENTDENASNDKQDMEATKTDDKKDVTTEPPKEKEQQKIEEENNTKELEEQVPVDTNASASEPYSASIEPNGEINAKIEDNVKNVNNKTEERNSDEISMAAITEDENKVEESDQNNEPSEKTSKEDINSDSSSTPAENMEQINEVTKEESPVDSSEADKTVELMNDTNNLHESENKTEDKTDVEKPESNGTETMAKDQPLLPSLDNNEDEMLNKNDIDRTNDKEIDNIMTSNNENDTSNSLQTSDEKNESEVVDTSETKENKRKLSEENKEEITSKKPKLEESKPCMRPKGVKKRFHGATFWPSNFRQKLCTCNECLSMYKHYSVLYLMDPEDTVTAYETLGKEKTNGATTQYEKGLEALSSLDRIQQINALTEYNKMRDKLLNYLKSFKDRKEIVKEEDIKAFFAEMKPKREPDGVYFCR